MALSIDGECISIIEDDNKNYSHAEQLHLFIKKVLEDTKLKMSNLDAIAVSKGPGSYTGLRIGVSTAKGLCYALEIPLISLHTLKILAKQVEQNTTEYPIIPMIDARRMEVYTAGFDAKHNMISEVEAKILDEESYQSYFKEFEKIYFIGNGVTKFKTVCSKPHQAIFIVNKNPSAKEMCDLADGLFKKNHFEDVAYFEPYYLKEFVAGK